LTPGSSAPCGSMSTLGRVALRCLVRTQRRSSCSSITSRRGQTRMSRTLQSSFSTTCNCFSHFFPPSFFAPASDALVHCRFSFATAHTHTHTHTQTCAHARAHPPTHSLAYLPTHSLTRTHFLLCVARHAVMAAEHRAANDSLAAGEARRPPLLVHCSAGVGRTGTRQHVLA
jgi:hypothetical protein